MSQGNNDIIYTAADIEKYHKGQLSAREMHALEKAALDDPFLADALEGYSVKDVNVNADITDLKNRLAKRIEQDDKVIPLTTGKITSFGWWKVAVMIVVVAGAGLLVFQTSFNKNDVTVAHTPVNNKNVQSEATDSVKKDSPGLLNTDTGTSSFLATEQSKTKIEYKLTVPDSPASFNATPGIKADSSASDKDVAATLSAPTTPVIPAEKSEEQGLTGYDRQLRTNRAKRQDYKVTFPNAQQPAAADDTGIVPKAAPNAIAQNKAKDQLYKGFTHSNVFRGRITDAHNNALPFSNITNTEDNIGTYSDAKGYFVLTSPDSVLNVQVSSVGFETSKVQLQNNVPANNIELKEDRSLAEVVIADKKINSKRSRDNNMVLEEPEPVDGWSNYDIYLANNLQTPEIFKDKQPDTRGEVELSFDVDKNGNPYNITVKKSLCESCDKEAIRLIKEGPKWKRKAKKGKATVKIAF